MNLARASLTFAFLFSLGALAAAGSGCSGGTCVSYCDVASACVAEQTCEVADSAAYKSACSDSCEAGLEDLGPSEEGLVKDCLRCFTRAFKLSCDATKVTDECKDECFNSAAQPALETWAEAVAKASANNSDLACKNGRPINGGEECSAGIGGSGNGMEESCIMSCGAGPSVEIECKGPPGGQPTCTCTAGNNKGKSFSGSCDGFFDDSNKIWDTCNL